ncbi:MAG: hypothetical protein ABFD14_07255 [Anaerolineaceae bacterium]|jgi:hypothetical protein
MTINQKETGYSYEILVKDHLEAYWSQYFEGWTIQNLEDGVFLLKNSNIDLAGLHGVLNRIRDLNLSLLSVKKIDEE